MDWFDAEIAVPGGGRAASGGRFYHVSFRSGSRGNGACARASHDYITREGEYGHGDRDPAIYTESDHMPSWAADAPSEYWDAADLYERANGRLYVSADFALPRDLSAEDQIALARDFAQELTKDEALPYTLAIHAGRDADGNEHNPHAHLMISERKNDGIERSPRAVVLPRQSDRPEPRAAPRRPARSTGRPGSSTPARDGRSSRTRRLATLGREERVDHRSYERQGIDHEAGRHYGPCAAHMASRGEITTGSRSPPPPPAIRSACRRLTARSPSLETERQALMSEDQKRAEWEWASASWSRPRRRHWP